MHGTWPHGHVVLPNTGTSCTCRHAAALVSWQVMSQCRTLDVTISETVLLSWEKLREGLGDRTPNSTRPHAGRRLKVEALREKAPQTSTQQLPEIMGRKSAPRKGLGRKREATSV